MVPLPPLYIFSNYGETSSLLTLRSAVAKRHPDSPGARFRHHRIRRNRMPACRLRIAVEETNRTLENKLGKDGEGRERTRLGQVERTEMFKNPPTARKERNNFQRQKSPLLPISQFANERTNYAQVTYITKRNKTTNNAFTQLK